MSAPADPLVDEECGRATCAPASDDSEAYRHLAAQIRAEGCVTDPWIDGKPRFSTEPIVIPRARYDALCRAAEGLALAFEALASLLVAEPRLLDVLGLTPMQKAMWSLSAGAWHGIARADLFFTNDGIVAAEINCDTPTGEPEAVTLSRLAATDHGHSDPNRLFRERFLAMVDVLARRERDPSAAPARTVGLVYPTELSEDLSLIRLYRSWFEGSGLEVVLGSPHNLDFDRGRTVLFGTPIDVLFRHYKTDWWGERSSAWRTSTVRDDPPLSGPLRAVAAGVLSGSLAVVNPFGAVAIQNKRALSLLWEQIHRFPSDVQTAIERYVPLTRRLEVMHAEQLLAQQREWVIKSDYGAEGEEVYVGREVTEATWREVVAEAKPDRWVAQRYFAAESTARGEQVNYGVFLLGGAAAGLFTRVQRGATNGQARSAATLVDVR